MWLGGAFAVLMVGCSHSTAEVTIKEESTGLHLPSGIAQIVRPVVTIQELTPEQNGDTVHVQGTVIGRAPLLSSSLYQVQDESGTVWVLSAEPLPPEAASVQVVGTLQVEPISVDGIDISDFYIRETSRTVADESAKPENADTSEGSTDAPPSQESAE